MNENFKKLGGVILKLGKAALIAAMSDAAANKGFGKPKSATQAPGQSKDEIFNLKEMDAYFRRLKDSGDPNKAASAAEEFRRVMVNVLEQSESADDDLFANFMNFQIERGLIQNTDVPEWNMPYDCRMSGYRKLMKEDWPKIYRKFKDADGIKKELERDIATDYKLSPKAQEFFKVKNDRDKVGGLGN